MTALVLPRVFPFDDPVVPYRVDLMQVIDLDQVIDIEREAFPTPWPASAYRYELTENALSTHLVLRRREAKGKQGALTRWFGRTMIEIVAYGGFWDIVGEAHISTIAVHPAWRGRGLGEMMLCALIDAAFLRHARELTLEVRVSNHVAQNLYKKYGFCQVGIRKGYYHDNNEDAFIMTVSDADGPGYQVWFASLKTRLRSALAGTRPAPTWGQGQGCRGGPLGGESLVG